MDEYILNWSDPQLKPSFLILPRSVDNARTSITLYGRGAPYYGAGDQQNILQMLEHFSSWEAPTTITIEGVTTTYGGTPPHPTQGQLWFDVTSNILQVYTNQGWSDIATDSIIIPLVQPQNPNATDLWYNVATDDLMYYNGIDWVNVGPLTIVTPSPGNIPPTLPSYEQGNPSNNPTYNQNTNTLWYDPSNNDIRFFWATNNGGSGSWVDVSDTGILNLHIANTLVHTTGAQQNLMNAVGTALWPANYPTSGVATSSTSATLTQLAYLNDYQGDFNALLSDRLQRQGGQSNAMIGALELSENPVLQNEAATIDYVNKWLFNAYALSQNYIDTKQPTPFSFTAPSAYASTAPSINDITNLKNYSIDPDNIVTPPIANIDVSTGVLIVDPTQPLSTLVQCNSNTITVTIPGAANTAIKIFAIGGTINAGTTTLGDNDSSPANLKTPGFATSKTVTTSANATLVLQASVTIPNSYNAAASCMVNINGYGTAFSMVTNNNPVVGSFAFNPVSNAEINSYAESNRNIKYVINGAAPLTPVTLTCIGGTIAVGTYEQSNIFNTSQSAITDANGALYIVARVSTTPAVTTPPTSPFNKSFSCNVYVNGGSTPHTFTAVTRQQDLTPNSFVFNSVSYAQLATVYTSDTITITGLEPNYPVVIQTISPSASTAKINAGSLVLGDNDGNGMNSTSQGYAVSKTVYTTAPNPSTGFLGGTLVLSAQVESSQSFATTNVCTVSVGTQVGSFIVTSETQVAANYTPNPFYFTPITNANPNVVYTSNMATVTGLTPNAAIIISGNNGALIDSGTTALSGTFQGSKEVLSSAYGSIVVAIQGSSGSGFYPGPNSIAVLSCTVGTVTESFTITNRPVDLIAAPISFSSIINASLGTTYISNTVTVTGVEPNYPFQLIVHGYEIVNGIETNIPGLATVDGGTTQLSGTFNPSITVMSSPAGTFKVAIKMATDQTDFNSIYTAQLQVAGSNNGTFTITTRQPNTVPDPFTFVPLTKVAVSTSFISNTITITGLEANTSVTVNVAGGLINAGTTSLTTGWQANAVSVISSASGTIQVAAQATSSTLPGVQTDCIVTISGISGTFSTTTSTTVSPPNSFAFTSQANVAPGGTYTSNTITLSGMTPLSTVTLTCAKTAGSANTSVSIDAGTTSLSGVFNVVQTVMTSATGTLVVAARLTIPSNADFYYQVNTVSVEGIQGNFVCTLQPVSATPNPFTFPSQSWPNDPIADPSNNPLFFTTPTTTLTGFTPASLILLTGNCQVDAGSNALTGSFSSTPVTVFASNTGTVVLQLRVPTSYISNQTHEFVTWLNVDSDVAGGAEPYGYAFALNSTTFKIYPYNVTSTTQLPVPYLNYDVFPNNLIIPPVNFATPASTNVLSPIALTGLSPNSEILVATGSPNNVSGGGIATLCAATTVTGLTGVYATTATATTDNTGTAYVQIQVVAPPTYSTYATFPFSISAVAQGTDPNPNITYLEAQDAIRVYTKLNSNL